MYSHLCFVARTSVPPRLSVRYVILILPVEALVTRFTETREKDILGYMDGCRKKHTFPQPYHVTYG